MANANTAYNDFHLPWFMFDIDNIQLITSTAIPSDISDKKDIILTEDPVPGLNYAPVNPAGGGNRKLAFSLPLIKRNNTVGNMLMLKQFDMLRNQSVGLLGLFSGGQFTPNPQVLYYWGTGSLPQVYWVKKCDPTNKQGWTNSIGMPQYSEISIELWLDETNILYPAEEIFRKLASLAGMVIGAYDVIQAQTKDQKPY